MKSQYTRVILIISIILCITIRLGYSFDDKLTHPAITYQAITNSNLKNYIINSLGVPEGLDKALTDYVYLIFPVNQSILVWLQQGSMDEDSPMCRASNHFHDPLLTWDRSYMTDSPAWLDAYCFTQTFTTRYSDITWATGFTSRNGTPITRNNQNMGWDDAKGYFYKALTSSASADRDMNLVKTFRSVGQVMHLLQDMAVPAHVRNDFQSHLTFTGVSSIIPTRWFGNPFEYYVSKNDRLITYKASEVPQFVTPLVTDFWDTTKIGSVRGLAEYTNANYFSDETIPNNNPSTGHIYPSPVVTSKICQDFEPGSKKPRKYISRTTTACPTVGSPVDHFAAVSFMNSEADINTGNLQIQKVWLDKNVHNTYALDLLPKAVGYSKALLDNFFRGTIGLSLPTQGVYATAAPGGTFNEFRVKAKNTTATGEEMLSGTIQLVVKYNLSLSDPYQSVLVNLGPDSYIVVPEKNGISALSKTNLTELVFNLSTNPLPLWAANVSFQVVYKGQLGNEANSVAVGFNDISEPTPVDVYNNTDYTCLNSTWYRYDDPAAMTIVDSNHDGIADRSDIYPHNITNIAFLGGPANAGTLNAAASNNLFAAGPLQPGNLLRMGYILTDKANSYAISETRTGPNGDPFTHLQGNNNYPGTGFVNDWNAWSGMFSFRGQKMWWGSGVIFTNKAYNGTCTWAALNQKLGF